MSMRFYLSSYKVGNETEKLKRMVPAGKKLGFIPNALDYVDALPRKESNEKNMRDLTTLGIDVEMLDLQDYFGKSKELQKKVGELGGVWVRGGNTFVLRQAMRLSGMDEILMHMDRKDFFYGGYSAGGCVLSPKLDYLQIADDPTVMPYTQKQTIWEGLGLIDFAFLPHYRSNHPESADVEKEVEYCKKNNIPFKTLRDGEVMIIE